MDIPDFTGGATMAGLQSQFQAKYEANILASTGIVHQVQPAHADMQMINAGAYMLFLHNQKLQSAAVMMLIPFSTGIVLDMLAKSFGVIRLLPQPALTTVRFVLNPGHGPLVIPAGLRVQSQDGLATFYLKAPITVLAGIDTYTSIAQCDTAGIIGNGYVIGVVNVILDPQPYLVSATNTDLTAGGSNQETDAAVRSRIYVAPGAFSCGGPDDAYIAIAKTASPSIIDAKVDNGAGGLVNIYVLVPGGVASAPVLAAVEAACNPKTVRPTSDLVTAYNPTVTNYSVHIDITLYGSVADPVAALADAYKAVKALTDENGSLLGVDTTLSQLSAKASVPGVFDANITSPVTNIVVADKTGVGICTGIVLNLIGFNYEK